MKKFLQTLACCVLAFLILLISQAVANIIGNILILVGFPIYMCMLIDIILYSLFTYLGIKSIIARIYNLDLHEIGIKKFSLRPVWCITALILPLAIIAVFLLINGNTSEPAHDDLPTALNAVLLYIMFIGIPQEMILRCVIMGIIRKNYNIKSAVIISSLISSIINIITSDNVINSTNIIPIFITGFMSGIMCALVLLESGNFWNNSLICVCIAILTVAMAIMGVDYNVDNTGIKFNLICLVGYIIVNVIAFAMIKKNSIKTVDKINQI